MKILKKVFGALDTIEKHERDKDMARPSRWNKPPSPKKKAPAPRKLRPPNS